MPANALEIDDVVLPLFHKYVSGGVPPASTFTTISPLANPQALWPVANDSDGDGLLVMVTGIVALQFTASDTVTMYEPAATPVILVVVAPLDQRKVNGATPPLTTETLALPFALPQELFVDDVETTGADVLETFAVLDDVQPLAEVTVNA